MPRKSKHIGVVACSVEGAALCFREIAAYSRKLMGEHLQIVAKAGAQLAICPDNSAHRAFKYVVARSPIPWLQQLTRRCNSVEPPHL